MRRSPILVLVTAALSVGSRSDAQGRQVDTVAVFRAIAQRERTTQARIDSIDAARCGSGQERSCRTRYPHPETWIIARPLPAGRLTELFAAAHGMDYRLDTQARPHCPWPAEAPPGAGQLVDVGLMVLGDGSVRVVASYECSNAPGMLHRINQRRDSWEVTRSGNTWVARRVTVSET